MEQVRDVNFSPHQRGVNIVAMKLEVVPVGEVIDSSPHLKKLFPEC